MHQRFTPLKIKAIGESSGLKPGQFTAYASVFDVVDSYGEVTRKGCFTHSINNATTNGPIPVLYGHDQTDPSSNIGEIVSAVEDDHGLLVTCQLDIDGEIENPVARQVYGLIKGRRLKSMSIGFFTRHSHVETIDDQPVLVLTDVDLREVSVVMTPANEAAQIMATKDNRPTFSQAEMILLAMANDDTNSFELLKGTTPMTTLRERYDSKQAELREFATKAANLGRDLTPEESSHVITLSREINEMKSKLEADAAKATVHDAVFERLKSMSLGEDNPDHSLPTYENETLTKPALLHAAPEFQSKVASAAAEIKTKATRVATKGLVTTGSVTTPILVDKDVVTLGRPPLSLLEVVPVIKVDAPTFSFIRQTKRVNNAAIVPTGERKPTSEYGVERVDDTLVVIAHLAKGIDKYILADAIQLQQFLTDEMVGGVFEKLQSYYVETVEATEGIQLQAFAEDKFTTIRSAMTTLQAQSLQPGLIVLNPFDWQAIEVTKADTAGTFIFGSAPVNQVEQKLWGVPVVVSHRVPQGGGYVLEANSTGIATDGNMDIAWDSSGESFEHNQVTLRVESRFKPYVRRAAGVVKLNLTD